MKYIVLCLDFGNVVEPVSSQTSDKCSAFPDVTLAYGDGKCITVQLRIVQKYSAVVPRHPTNYPFRK